MYNLMPETSDTSARILQAAELLFAAHGIDGVSLRQITKSAGVNVAALNYHHTDKETLYARLITQRLRQLHAARMEFLVEAETLAGAAPVPLPTLARILAAPLLQPTAAMTGFSAASRRLVGRLLLDPHPLHAALIAAELQPSLTRLGQAFRRHQPAVRPADFVWTFSLIVGALHHAAASLHDMRSRTSGVCGDEDAVNAVSNFERLVCASFAPRGDIQGY